MGVLLNLWIPVACGSNHENHLLSLHVDSLRSISFLWPHSHFHLAIPRLQI